MNPALKKEAPTHSQYEVHGVNYHLDHNINNAHVGPYHTYRTDNSIHRLDNPHHHVWAAPPDVRFGYIQTPHQPMSMPMTYSHDLNQPQYYPQQYPPNLSFNHFSPEAAHMLQHPTEAHSEGHFDEQQIQKIQHEVDHVLDNSTLTRSTENTQSVEALQKSLELQKAMEEMKKMQAMIDQQKAEIEAQKNQINELQKEKPAQSNDNISEKALNNANDQIASLTAELDKYKAGEQISQMNAESKDVQAEIDQAKQENMELKTQLDQINNENLQLQQTIETLEKIKEDLANQLEITQNENIRLKTMLNDATSAIDQLQSQKNVDNAASLPEDYKCFEGRQEVQERDMALFFLDLQGMTKFSESLNQKDYANLLIVFQTTMINEFKKAGLVLKDSAGDGFFCIAPEDRDYGQIFSMIDNLNSVLEKNLKEKLGIEHDVHIRIGIEQGTVHAGYHPDIGPLVFGPDVITAARFEQIGKMYDYGGANLISDKVYNDLDSNNQKRCRELDDALLPGQNKEAKKFFQYLPENDFRLKYNPSFNLARKFYNEKKFDQAWGLFADIFLENEQKGRKDLAVEMYCDRLKSLLSLTDLGRKAENMDSSVRITKKSAAPEIRNQQRKYERQSVNQEGILSLDGKDFNGIMTDISRGGAGFKLSSSIESGDYTNKKVNLRLDIKGYDKTEFSGSVLRLHNGMCGVEFDKPLSEKEMKAFQNQINQSESGDKNEINQPESGDKNQFQTLFSNSDLKPKFDAEDQQPFADDYLYAQQHAA